MEKLISRILVGSIFIFVQLAPTYSYAQISGNQESLDRNSEEQIVQIFKQRAIDHGYQFVDISKQPIQVKTSMENNKFSRLLHALVSPEVTINGEKRRIIGKLFRPNSTSVEKSSVEEFMISFAFQDEPSKALASEVFTYDPNIPLSQTKKLMISAIQKMTIEFETNFYKDLYASNNDKAKAARSPSNATDAFKIVGGIIVFIGVIYVAVACPPLGLLLAIFFGVLLSSVEIPTLTPNKEMITYSEATT